MNGFRAIIVSLLLSNFAFAQNLQELSLQLKWKHQFQFAGFYAAKELGYYEDAGIKLQIKELQPHTNVVASVVNQESDFGISDSVLIYKYLTGKPVVAMMPIMQKSPVVLLTLAKNNIKNLEQLRNRPVELAKRSMYNTSLLAMLRANNIDIEHKPRTVSLEKFINEEVDAISAYLTNEPFILKEKGLQVNAFNPNEYGFDFYGDMLFTSKEFLQNNAEAADAFYHATKKGWEYALRNQEEIIDLIYKKYNTQNKSKKLLRYEAQAIYDLSGIEDGTFGKIEVNQFETIKKTYALLFPGKFQNNSIEDMLFFPSKDSFSLTKFDREYLNSKKEFIVCTHGNFNLDGGEEEEIGGIAGDYFKIISQKTGMAFKARQHHRQKELLQSIKTNGCDLVSIISTRFNTLDNVNVTEPYYKDHFALITALDKPFKDSMALLEGKLLLTHCSNFKKHLDKNFPNLNVAVLNDKNKAIDQVLSGQAYGYLALNETA
ncbi:MAG: ABC transporter substrate-binding protein, partial [Campylobacterota bacterium]